MSGLPGMHRFFWDLRYQRSGNGGVADYDGEAADFPGPFVLPGSYKIRLTANAGKFEQTLEVIQDPRSGATPADLTQQFAWAKRAFQDVVTARKLSEQVKKEQGSHLDVYAKDLAAATRNLRAALTAFESSDRAPTSQAIELYRESHALLQRLQK